MKPTFRHRRPASNMTPFANNCNRLFPPVLIFWENEPNLGLTRMVVRGARIVPIAVGRVSRPTSSPVLSRGSKGGRNVFGGTPNTATGTVALPILTVFWSDSPDNVEEPQALAAQPVALTVGQKYCLTPCPLSIPSGLEDTCVIFEMKDNAAMKNFTAVVERDPDTGLLVGCVPGFPGAHSQAESLDELQANRSRSHCHAA